MIEAVVLSLLIGFADTCLGLPGRDCRPTPTPGTYEVVVRTEGTQKTYVERRCTLDRSYCNERPIGPAGR